MGGICEFKTRTTLDIQLYKYIKTFGWNELPMGEVLDLRDFDN
jgi:hypothetical protein